MRIVFDFHGTQLGTTGSGYAYSGGCSRPFEWGGFHVSVSMYDEVGRGSDFVNIEGNGDGIRRGLLSLVSVIDAVEAAERQRVSALVARQQQCATCATWMDPEAPWHADGKGNRCAASKEKDA